MGQKRRFLCAENHLRSYPVTPHQAGGYARALEAWHLLGIPNAGQINRVCDLVHELMAWHPAFRFPAGY